MNSKLVLVLAFITISAGLYGVSGSLMETQEQEAPVQVSKKSVKQISVWQAKHPLDKGQRISRSDLNLVKLPENEARDQGIAKSYSIDFRQHWYLNRSLNSNEVLFREDLLKPGDKDYLSLVIDDGYTPYNLALSEDAILGGSISFDDRVDISTISSSRQNLSHEGYINDVTQLELALLLPEVRVLDITYPKKAKKGKASEVILTLQVTNRQLAKLSIAKRIAEIEVHKSSGTEQASQLYADSGDVIQSSVIRSVREFRSN